MKKFLYLILSILVFFVIQNTYKYIVPNSALKIFAPKYTEQSSPGLKSVDIKNIYKIENSGHLIDNLYLIDTGINYSVLKIENNDKKLQDLLANANNLKNDSKTLALELSPQYTKGYNGVVSTLNIDRPKGEVNVYSQALFDIVTKYNSSNIEKYRDTNDSNTLIPINLSYVFITPEIRPYDFKDWLTLVFLGIFIALVLHTIKGMDKKSNNEMQGVDELDEN